MLHEPVLKEEVLQWLRLSAGSRVVDATAGFGGHTLGLWEKVIPGGQVIAIDRDRQAIQHCKELFKDKKEIHCVHDNFRNLRLILDQVGLSEVDGILMDCGVSSRQLDDASRGFSFQTEGPLDMRMDERQDLTLKDCLRDMADNELADIIYGYGEERYSRRIARDMKEAFKEGRIHNTRDLAEVIWHAVPPKYRHGKIHPATRTFQALRIHVNAELESLEEGLKEGLQVLSHEGRIAVITFHSLEDRIVKHLFHQKEKDGLGRRLTKKPLGPTAEEIQRNARARSAKLRVFEKTS